MRNTLLLSFVLIPIRQLFAGNEVSSLKAYFVQLRCLAYAETPA